MASTAVVGTDGSVDEQMDIIRALEIAPEIMRKDERNDYRIWLDI